MHLGCTAAVGQSDSGDNAPAHTMIEPDGSSRWPFPPEGANASASMPPVVGWSKWDLNAALVVPYSGAFRCPSDSWDALEAQLEAIAGVPWEERKEVAFGRWNGFCTHYIPWMKTADGKVMKCPRTHLNSLSEAHPDLLDAYDLSKGSRVPLGHQNVYKYIVSPDGWSISSKFDKYLLLGSTILKAASTRYGFYYDAIKPYVHFLPFMVNTSDDIVDVVRWAKSHDAEARRVAEEGRRFALRHLSRPARLCYVFRLLTELSKQLRYRPSCARRGLCVPLVSELRFLAKYQRTAGSCRYKEVLLRYGDDDPAASDPPVPTSGTFRDAPNAFDYEQLLRLHEGGHAWPRDDLATAA
ncbi:hypothetical protein GPECTOR_55g333 [Gonium pectorale]|uniref:Glycosyl transferase CAP10 domain-containing protein n=1 Tax=Gonium pectorale TaxID=33097 RepID=A0A150G6F5_GONPE|nr:hypothetical protein GPECTOR_55g333 [Gonium pectorale]|eukprot:KXZ45427.1 hypothetical protein GPECTOR_55g333 [Gonium pectorale]